MTYDPAFWYDTRDTRWRWDARKLDLVESDVIRSLWRDYNEVAIVPLQRIESFLHDVQRISSLSETQEVFIAEMRRNRESRRTGLSKRLHETLSRMTSASNGMPLDICHLIDRLWKTPSIDNFCDLLDHIHKFSWPKPGDAGCTTAIAKAQPPAPPPKRPTHIWSVFDQAYISIDEDNEFSDSQQADEEWAMYELGLTQNDDFPTYLESEFQPGHVVKRRADEIHDETAQGSPEPPSKRHKRAHDGDPSGDCELQPTRSVQPSPPSGKDGVSSQSSRCDTSATTITAPSDAERQSGPKPRPDPKRQSDVKPHPKLQPNAEHQPVGPPNGKRARDVDADERPTDAKRRNTDTASQQAAKPPRDEEHINDASTTRKPTRAPTGKRARDEDADKPPTDTKRRKTAGAPQRPANPPRRKRTCGEDVVAGSSEIATDTARPLPPTPQDKASVAPVTRKQMRSAKPSELLELDGGGNSTRQSTRASRARGGDNKEPSAKVDTKPTRGAASRSSPRDAQANKRSQRASARR